MRSLLSRGLCLCVFLLLAHAAFGANDSLVANTGLSCQAVEIGECVPCTANGNQYSVKATSYKAGHVSYDEFLDSDCQEYAGSHSRSPSNCLATPSCTIAPAFLRLFHVQAETPLSISCAKNSFGAIFLNSTSAVSYASDALLAFYDGSDVLHYRGSQNGSVSTSMGTCPYDTLCKFNGFSVYMEDVAIGDNLLGAVAKIQAALQHLTETNDPMVTIVLESGYRLSTTGENVFVLGPKGPSLAASALSTAVVQFPIDYTLKGMSLETDESESILAAEVKWNGFSEYQEIDCDVVGETSFKDEKIWCYPSFSAQIHREAKEMSAYEDAHVDIRESQWEEQTAFSLF